MALPTTTMVGIVENPFRLLPDEDPFAPAETRRLELFGAPVELAWLPGRKKRGGIPGRDRPPFRAGVAERIMREEALWHGPDVVLTPNKFPFARRHALLWSEAPVREAPVVLLAAAFEMVAEHGGTALSNCIGSAASIQRSHVHLVEERMPFLGALPTEAFDADDLLPAGLAVEVVALQGLPFTGVGIRGTPKDRAVAAQRLIELRLTAAFNLIDDGSTAWVFPRGREIPAPHFPFALGAAELWGRWCYGDEEPYRAATEGDLEAALDLAGMRPPG